MGWFTRFDRFGDAHICFSQADPMSCGLASIKMVIFKVNKLRPGHDALATEAAIEKIYKKYDNVPDKIGDIGVIFPKLADALNEFGIGNWKSATPPQGQMTEFLVDKLAPDKVGLGLINTAMRGYPIILKVEWPSSGAGIAGGAHAVVLDTINKIPIVDAWWGSICDPADGDVHITRMRKNAVLNYVGKAVKFSKNLFGEGPKYDYGTSDTTGTVTEVVYCEKPAPFFG
jgi:hypothetical protein